MKYLWDLEQVLRCYSPDSFKGRVENFEQLVRDGFSLTRPVGNNSFSYVEGRALYVAPVIVGAEEDILAGDRLVFEDWQDEKLLSCKGLANYVVGHSGQSGTPIYVCDNHNMVLEAWELLASTEPCCTLVHVDQHRDDAVYLGSEDEWLSEARICDYIDCAVKSRWIDSRVISYIESGDLCQKVSLGPDERFILNIDMDFFVPEVTVVSLEEKVDLLFHYLPQTELITMATSPGFIKPVLATEIAKLLWRYL